MSNVFLLKCLDEGNEEAFFRMLETCEKEAFETFTTEVQPRSMFSIAGEVHGTLLIYMTSCGGSVSTQFFCRFVDWMAERDSNDLRFFRKKNSIGRCFITELFAQKRYEWIAARLEFLSLMFNVDCFDHAIQNCNNPVLFKRLLGCGLPVNPTKLRKTENKRIRQMCVLHTPKNLRRLFLPEDLIFFKALKLFCFLD